jgi:hypothetical protein
MDVLDPFHDVVECIVEIGSIIFFRIWYPAEENLHMKMCV